MISTFLKTFHSRASEEQLVSEPDLKGARQNLEGSTLPKDSGRSDQSSPPSQKPATSDYIGNLTTTQHQGFKPPGALALTKDNFFPSSTSKKNEDEVFSQALLTSPDDLNREKLIDQCPGIPKDQSVSLPRQKKHLRFSDPLVTDVRLIPAREEKIGTLPPKRKTTARKNKPIGGTPFNHTIPVAIIAPTAVSGHDLPIAEVIRASPIETSAIQEVSASS